LEIQDRLPESFVFGMQQRVGFPLIPRAQTELFAGSGILAVENFPATEESELWLHRDSQIVPASDPLALASSGRVSAEYRGIPDGVWLSAQVY
jgi:hypothetical protein